MTSELSALISNLQRSNTSIETPISNVIPISDSNLDFDIDTPDIETIETDSFVQVQDNANGSLIFGIIGLGQCGERLASSFYELGYTKSIVINTSFHDLHDLPIPTKLKIGNTDGAGKNMEVSYDAFTKEKSNILHTMAKIFGNDIDSILICAGAGGGTGSGTIISAIELSKIYLRSIGKENVNSKVGAITTIPTNNEVSSPIVKENAIKVLTSLSEMANNDLISPFIVIDNDRVRELFPKLTVTSFYPTINKTISQLFHTFNVISTKQSELISFDKADYATIINCAGHMIMGAITVKDYTSAENIAKAFRNNIESTLLASEFDLETAKVVGIIVLGGKEIFDTVPGLMSSIEDAFGTISFLTGKATVHRGLYVNNSNVLRVLTLIGGLKEPIRRYKKLLNN